MKSHQIPGLKFSRTLKINLPYNTKVYSARKYANLIKEVELSKPLVVKYANSKARKTIY